MYHRVVSTWYGYHRVVSTWYGCHRVVSTWNGCHRPMYEFSHGYHPSTHAGLVGYDRHLKKCPDFPDPPLFLARRHSADPVQRSHFFSGVPALAVMRGPELWRGGRSPPHTPLPQYVPYFNRLPPWQFGGLMLAGCALGCATLAAVFVSAAPGARCSWCMVTMVDLKLLSLFHAVQGAEKWDG